MKAKDIRNFLIEKGAVTQAAGDAIHRALSVAGLVDGRADISKEPPQAAWEIFSLLACPNSNFHSALMWVKDRRDEWRWFNKDEDFPTFALAYYLALPAEIEKRGVKYFGFSGDGRLFIFRSGAVDILPKRLSAWEADNPRKWIRSTDAPPAKSILVQGSVIKELAEYIGLSVKLDAKAFAL